MPGVDFRGTAGEEGKGIVIADGFQTGGASNPKVAVSTTVTFNPPSLATGAFAEADVTVTGAALGDSIQLFPPYDTQGIMYQGSVASSNTVTIALNSCNAGTVDLASGSWGVVVWRR
jgi:hypothetical protein